MIKVIKNLAKNKVASGLNIPRTGGNQFLEKTI
jgi:hypothetical protein